MKYSLLQRILEEGTGTLSSRHEDHEEGWSVDKALDGVVPVVVDNLIGRYYELEDRGLELMPPLRPPFTKTWVEAPLPGGEAEHRRVAILYGPSEKPDLCYAMLFTQQADPPFSPFGPLCTLHVPLDDRGRFDGVASDIYSRYRTVMGAERSLVLRPPGVSNPKDYRLALDWFVEHGEADVKHAAVDLVKSLLFCIGFMNCSNVGTVAGPVAGTRAQRRRREREGKPQVRYRTVVVRPHTSKKGRRGGEMESAEGGQRSMHICRGHFHHYTAEAPLFGRPGNVGSFWIPDHVRGTKDAGIVIKDYEVLPV